MQMNPNQYYGPQSNYMPMQNTQPYYQPPVMSPRPPEPNYVPPTSQVPQFNQQPISRQVSVSQFNQPQYQYSNNQSPNYPAVSPVQSVPQYQPAAPNMMPTQVNAVQPPIQQAYQSSQPNQMPYYPNQNIPNQTYNNVTTPNQYTPANVDTQGGYNGGQMVQNAYSPPPNQANVYNAPQADPQQMSYPVTPQATNPPPTTTEEPASTSNNEPVQYQEPTHEKVRSFRPTNVVGDYKCSDFPNLFTGPFRYSGSPVQRKPFTMRNESNRPASQPNTSSTDRKSHIGLTRNNKRWELRGGKYYGCFTSRTNGLQDICPKAKCKICPTDKKK